MLDLIRFSNKTVKAEPIVFHTFSLNNLVNIKGLFWKVNDNQNSLEQFEAKLIRTTKLSPWLAKVC